MTSEERKILDKIISHSITGTVSWDDLFNAFDEKTLQSSAMEEILLALENSGIEVVDFKPSVEKTENPDFIYVRMQVYSFKDCISELRKYEGGDIFCDYLEGKTIPAICEKHALEKPAVTKTIRRFAKYISCWDLEKNYLGIFLKYKVPLSSAICKFYLDVLTYKFLYVRSLVIPEKEKDKYKIPEKFSEVIESLELKEEA